MSNENKAFDLLSNAHFEIGGEDQLLELSTKYSQEPMDDSSKRPLNADWERFLANLHARTGTLLKADTVSFFLGAGASKECGGLLIGNIPLELEMQLLKEGISGVSRLSVREWIKCFYLAVWCTKDSKTFATPSNRREILKRWEVLSGGKPEALSANLEKVLSLLYRWRAALPTEGGRLRLDGEQTVDLKAKVIEECLHHTTSALVSLCNLPTSSAVPGGFEAYKNLLRKILTRPLNLKRANVFSLNYDTLVEQAADAEGVVLIDGFVGLIRRIFRPESYDHDLYFPAETTEGRVHRLDRVMHLYKLHGSITWMTEEPSWENPYGIREQPDSVSVDKRTLIYPTPAKGSTTLGIPYSELLRRFATTIVKPQSVLFMIGYGFGDEHINAILIQALAIPSFTLVIVSPNPSNKFVTTLREQKDRRVWILSGNTFGTFSGFVRYALADLRDEVINRKVMETQRALADIKSAETDGGTSNG